MTHTKAATIISEICLKNGWELRSVRKGRRSWVAAYSRPDRPLCAVYGRTLDHLCDSFFDPSAHYDRQGLIKAVPEPITAS